MQRPIYLDHQATTPLDPRILPRILPHFTETYGNPASQNHIYGWEAAAAVDQARQTLATAINAEPEEIIWTSGATESNNLAIKGIAETRHHQGRHIITLATEHNAVLDPCHYLKTLGFEITVLPVQPDGLLDLNQLDQAIRPDTILVSAMAANNEIGVLQPIAQIGQHCHDRHIPFHTDAAQALGKIPLDVQAQNIDLMSLTAHKMYGPKGIGALYIRRKNPRIRLSPQIHGGGQERSLRSGTLNTPLIVGFAAALELALADRSAEQTRLAMLRDRLWQTLIPLGGIHRNGHPSQCLANNLNISFEGVDGNALLLALRPTVALSSGSACTTTHPTPSHVLTALGHNPVLAQASLRLGLGRSTTLEDIDRVATAIIKAVQALRDL